MSPMGFEPILRKELVPKTSVSAIPPKGHNAPDGSRTHTLSNKILSLACLPIPPQVLGGVTRDITTP